MKVRELKKMLENLNDDDRIVMYDWNTGMPTEAYIYINKKMDDDHYQRAYLSVEDPDGNIYLG